MDATSSPSARPGFLVWLALLALAGYGIFLARYAAVQPGGSDSSGYFNTARLLEHGRVAMPVRPLPGVNPAPLPSMAGAPLGFRPDPTHTRLLPTYPIGLPLFLLAATRTAGAAHGPDLLFIAHALAGVGLLYGLARAMGCSRPAAGLGAVLLGGSPLYLMYALHAMSDLPSLVWVTAAVWLAWESPRRNRLALAAGFALGIAVLLRPTNLLAVVPVGLALGPAPRRWAGLILGGLPCAAALLAFNRAAYGAAFTSGYAEVAGLISVRWLPVTLGHYARWLPVVASPLVLAALGLPWLWRSARRTVLVLGSWIVLCLGFYACYFHTHEWWWYLRFILPALPALLIAALLVIERIAAGRLAPWAWAAAAALALAGQAGWVRHWGVLSIGQQENIYRDATRWAETRVPGDAVILCMQMSGALCYYTGHPLLRWDKLEDAWPQIRTSLAQSGRPVYGLFFDFEEKPATTESTPGRWVKLGQLRQVSLWRLDPGAAP